MALRTAVLRTTTHTRFPHQSVFFMLAVGFLASGVRAADPEFSWVPVDASAPFTTAQPDAAGQGTEIILANSGAGGIVEFEIRINGWGSAPGAPLLSIVQATADMAGLLGVNAVPANPGVDLTPLNNQAWRVNPGGNGRSDGAFISLQTCHDAGGANVGPRCATHPSMTLDACPPGMSCSDNDDFVFFGNLDVVGVLSIATANYAWGGLSVAGQCTPDNGGSYYLGTLVLNVPGGATGTYTFGFDPDPAQTFLIDCPGWIIENVILTPGHVTARDSGRCCTGAPLFTCEDDVLPEDCTGANQSFELGARCLDPLSCDCFPECVFNQDCDEGNACTVDVCPIDTCQCVNTPNYDHTIECCNTSTGNITVIDDGDECTIDQCQPFTGLVTHTALCVDGDACTDDVCLPGGSCTYPLNYNPATECCDPSSGVVSQIDDSEVCTDDSCDSLTGQVSHSPVCPEFSWVPVDASVPFTTARPDWAGVDTRLIMSPSPTDEIVEFEIRINGWSNVPGARTLGMAQATVDASGFLGANAVPANPGIDLTPLNNQVWRVNPGGNGKDDGAFITLQTCRAAPPVDVQPRCGTEPPMVLDPCPAGTTCVDNNDFVFFWHLQMAAVSVATPNYAWGALSNFGECTADTGGSYYLGTLVLNVPAGAVGSYSFGFVPDPSWTFLADCPQLPFEDVLLTPGHVTVANVEAPRAAPYPHDRKKNRYISFDPTKSGNDGSNVAFRVELKQITLGSCDDGTGAQGGNVDFCRTDRGPADCKACSGSGDSCISAPIDCPPGESCDPTGAVCVNDAPNAGGSNVGMIWWVGPEKATAADPSLNIHLLVSEPFRKVSIDWPNPVHAGDCEVVPRASYGVRGVNVDIGTESDELVVETTRFPPVAPPAPFWWGDVVGVLAFHCNADIREQTCDLTTSNGDCTGPATPAACCTGVATGLCDCPGGDPCERAWDLPNGVTNIDDVTAALWTSAPAPPTTVSADFTWVDVHGNDSFTPGSQNFDPPNNKINASDLQQIGSAFGGLPYKFYDPADCPDESDWPPP